MGITHHQRYHRNIVTSSNLTTPNWLRERNREMPATLIAPRGQLTDLREFTSAAPVGSIDREAGIIRGVKVIGCDSKNGYSYTKESLNEAVPLFNGAVVNVEHDPTGK